METEHEGDRQLLRASGPPVQGHHSCGVLARAAAQRRAGICAARPRWDGARLGAADSVRDPADRPQPDCWRPCLLLSSRSPPPYLDHEPSCQAGSASRRFTGAAMTVTASLADFDSGVVRVDEEASVPGLNFAVFHRGAVLSSASDVLNLDTKVEARPA